MAKCRITVENYPTYLKFIRYKSVRKFNNIGEVEVFLNREVFAKKDFQNNVSDTADNCKVSYDLAYKIITNYLIDLLYEIDIAQSKHRRKTRIRIKNFINYDIGFIKSLKDKPFTQRRDLDFQLEKFKNEIKNQ